MPRKPPKGKSLAEVNPELAKEWHQTKNSDLTGLDVTAQSHKKVWWKCDKGDDHEWTASVAHRSNGRGCSVCSGRKIVKSNCLATVNPELSEQWHPVKNGSLTPDDVGPGSSKKVWWKCPKGDDHEWIISVNGRKNGRMGCPICSGHKVSKSTSLFSLYPIIASQWHPSKNGVISPNEVSTNSNIKVWWKCPKGDDHEWKTSIGNRVSQKTGCPICKKRTITKSNSLTQLNPTLAKQWHPVKNGSLTPDDVGPGSSKKVWWKCPKGDDHEWIVSVSNRSYDTGCPFCTSNKTSKSTSIAILNPKLAKEFHPLLNKNLTTFELSPKSNLKIWWKCPKGDDHEWKNSVANRSIGQDCPFCTLTPQSRQELTITFELKQFFRINPKGFKTRVKSKLWSIDIYLSELNLGVEFDGSYWHKDKRALDKLKTEQLQDEGFQIMRIREEPLKPITDIDVVSKIPFNAKHVTNEILKHIMDAYTLDQKKIDLIKHYLRKKTIQNEQGLEDYIEQILTEKAERKKNK